MTQGESGRTGSPRLGTASSKATALDHLPRCDESPL